MVFRDISLSFLFSRSFVLLDEGDGDLIEEYIIMIIDFCVGVGIDVDNIQFGRKKKENEGIIILLHRGYAADRKARLGFGGPR